MTAPEPTLSDQADVWLVTPDVEGIPVDDHAEPDDISPEHVHVETDEDPNEDWRLV